MRGCSYGGHLVDVEAGPVLFNETLEEPQHLLDASTHLGDVTACLISPDEP